MRTSTESLDIYDGRHRKNLPHADREANTQNDVFPDQPLLQQSNHGGEQGVGSGGYAGDGYKARTLHRKNDGTKVFGVEFLFRL